jgi:hypothetical protein
MDQRERIAFFIKQELTVAHKRDPFKIPNAVIDQFTENVMTPKETIGNFLQRMLS